MTGPTDDTAGPTDDEALREDFGIETSGLEEGVVVPWPVLLRQRVHGRALASDRYPWIVLSAALFGLFTVGFSITVLSIAIENIAAEFGTTKGTLIWVITGPILLGAIVTPGAGKLADLYGARRVYLTAMLCVSLFAALAALSWSAPSLIVFRILGGAIGAATGPASIALITRLFPRERRAQALGYWALVGAGGPVLGVVIGGPVVQFITWRWIFAAQVPLSLATVAVCALVFPDTERNRSTTFDFAGAVLLALSVGSFVVALNRAPEPGWGWTHPLVVAGFVVAPALLAAFVVHERRTANQLMPLRYLHRRNVVFPMISLFCLNFAYMGGFFLTPFLLENVLGYSPSKTGFVSIARPFAFAVAGPLAGWVATRVGERVNGMVGAFFVLCSMLVFSSVTSGSTELIVLFALVLSGVGMGTMAPAMATAVANSVDNEDLGVASGAEQMLAQIGVVVGTQVMITVQQSASGTGDISGYSHGYLVGALAAGLGLLAVSFVRRTVSAAESRADRVPAVLTATS